MFSSEIPEFSPGDLVVLVHGALADARMWQPHLSMLKQPAYALTQRHFGSQGETHTGEFGINRHSQDLLEWLRALPSDVHAHLVGWSYGADVVLAALTHNPNQVRSAWLYDPGYPGYLKKEAMADFMQDASDMFDPVLPCLERGDLHSAVAALIDGSGQSAGYFQRQSESQKLQQLDNAHTLVQQMQQAPASDLTAAQVAAIDIPVSVVTGHHSRILFQQVAAAAAELLGGRPLQRVEGNHMWPLEQPAEMAKYLQRHLDEFSVAVQQPQRHELVVDE